MILHKFSNNLSFN